MIIIFLIRFCHIYLLSRNITDDRERKGGKSPVIFYFRHTCQQFLGWGCRFEVRVNRFSLPCFFVFVLFLNLRILQYFSGLAIKKNSLKKKKEAVKKKDMVHTVYNLSFVGVVNNTSNCVYWNVGHRYNKWWLLTSPRQSFHFAVADLEIYNDLNCPWFTSFSDFQVLVLIP